MFHACGNDLNNSIKRLEHDPFQQLNGLQGHSHCGDQGGHAAIIPPNSISEPNKVQQFQFQTSEILLLKGVQK